MKIILITAIIAAGGSGTSPGADLQGKTDIGEKSTGYILCTPDGRVLLSKNSDRAYVPASTLKVITSLSAMHYLGENYRFRTDFFIDPDNNLKIKGYGDPLFTSELIADACKNIEKALEVRRIKRINSIIVDSTFFAGNIEIDGRSGSDNPYDAPVGSTCANFNTVAFIYDRKSGTYESPEPQTPALPFLTGRIASSGLKEGRIVLSEGERGIYAGSLVAYFLSEHGIGTDNGVRQGTIKGNDKLIYSFVSPYRLNDIIKMLLRYSNNFIANQLFLTVGAETYYPPATVEKGCSAMKEYAKKYIGISEPLFSEGSGLSRQNRISPADMIKALNRMKKEHTLMQNQIMPDGRIVEFYKTGTLNGVRTRCGYFETEKGLYSFAVMINGSNERSEKTVEMLWKKVGADLAGRNK